MKYYIISGETSGDQHASNVIRELSLLDAKAKFRGMGGDLSQQVGQKLTIHQKEMAIMGFIEILSSLFRIFKNLRIIKNDILKWKPDAVLLVDYPGFNLRIAKFCKTIKIPVHYYIPPKVWAWRESRVKKIKAHIDFLYTILPFETPYFNNRNISHTYVGNPSKESVDQYLKTHTAQADKKFIALLPGSRKQEISTSLPIMLEAVKGLDIPVLVAQAPGFEADFYHLFGQDFTLLKGDMYTLLSKSKIALVTSGTATLETALMGVPQIVCYRTTRLSYWIGKSVIQVNYISLVNLILNKPSITELIQHDFNAKNLSAEITTLLNNPNNVEKMKQDYATLHLEMGSSFPAKKVAKLIVDSLSH